MGRGACKFSVVVPVKTVSEANRRDYWRTKAKRAQGQRATADAVVTSYLKTKPTGNLIILLTRIGPRKLDSDNLSISMKAVRDGVADAIGRDDGDETLQWNYAQEKGDYAVRVEFL